MSVLSINSASGDKRHEDHIICCKKPGADFAKKAVVINGAVGLGLAGWGLVEVIKALAVCTVVGTAAWCGAGIVLIALAAILWTAYTLIQYRAAENKQKDLENRDVQVNSQPTVATPVIPSASPVYLI